MIREYRAAHPRPTYRAALAAVLDYHGLHAFELLLITPGEGEQRLARAKHSVISGGEKSAAIYLPLFAAANAGTSVPRPLSEAKPAAGSWREPPRGVYTPPGAALAAWLVTQPLVSNATELV